MSLIDKILCFLGFHTWVETNHSRYCAHCMRIEPREFIRDKDGSPYWFYNSKEYIKRILVYLFIIALCVSIILG